MNKFQKHMVTKAYRDMGLPFQKDHLLEEAWFPTKLSNPTKLQLHVWVDDRWYPTSFWKHDQISEYES